MVIMNPNKFKEDKIQKSLDLSDDLKEFDKNQEVSAINLDDFRRKRC